MMFKKIQKVVMMATSLFIVPAFLSSALAELKLPSGSDRPPNLSLDPFERAREAVRTLPSAKEEPVKPAPEKRQSVSAPAPVAATEPTAVSEAVPAEEEPASAFSQEIVFTSEWFAKLQGGVPPPEPVSPDQPVEDPGSSAMLGLLEYTAEVNTGPLGLWADGKFFVHIGVAFENKSPSDFVGDIHGISGNDPGGNFVKLWEAFYEHSFKSSNSSILFGVYDWNSEFYISEYANLFMNGAPGMGNVVNYGVLPAGPSTYPLTSLGIRLKVDLNPNLYMMLSAHDAVAGPLESFVDLTLNKNDGVFSAVEFGFHKNAPGAEEGYYKLAVGGWYLKQAITSMTGIDQEADIVYRSGGDPAVAGDPPPFVSRPGNAGMYFVAETSIGQTLGIFAKMGRANPELNRYPEFYTAGINYTGLIPGREADVLGLAVIQTTQGSVFLELNPLEDPADDSSVFFTKEVVYEATYSTQLTDWLMIQPDIQFVLQPGMSQYNGNAWVIGLRAQAVY